MPRLRACPANVSYEEEQAEIKTNVMKVPGRTHTNSAFEFWQIYENSQFKQRKCDTLVVPIEEVHKMSKAKRHVYENVIPGSTTSAETRNLLPIQLSQYKDTGKADTMNTNLDILVVPSQSNPTISITDESELNGNEHTNKAEQIVNSFIEAIRNKDDGKLKEMLHEYKKLHLYLYVDPSGVSALEWAVAVDSLDIVDLLLENSPYDDERMDMIRHTINIAIRYNKMDIMKYLLHQKKNNRWNQQMATSTMKHSNHTLGTKKRTSSDSTKTSKSRFEDARFEDGISPIILAAQLGKNEMVSLLISSGESDIHPVTATCTNPQSCTMYPCKRSSAGLFTLEESLALVQKYKALSSPSFILNSGVKDPVHEAFEITVVMDTLCVEDPAFKVEYLEISKRCRKFVCDLTSLCRSSEELDAFIQKSPGLPSSTYACCKRNAHGRIQMAMAYKQKEFVTHPYIQKYLQKSWYDGVPEFLSSQTGKSWHLTTLLIVLGHPFLSLIYMFQFCGFVNNLMKAAALKFLSHLVSYMIFLILLILLTIFNQGWMRGTHCPYMQTLYWMIVSWVLGFTIRHLKLFFTRSNDHCKFEYGFDAFRWRFYDTIFIIFLWGALVCHLSIMYDLIEESVMDLHIVSPLYAIACLLAFLRVSSFLKASSKLGPLYISLKKMTLDIGKFSVLVFIFLAANIMASIHLHRGSKPLSVDTTSPSPTSSNINNRPPADVSLMKTLVGESNAEGFPLNTTTLFIENLEAYFWAFFGPDEKDQLTRNLNGLQTFHRSVGYILLYGYFICMPIVLLNMLIAMMANSYTKIKANSDIEWKFAWSRLRMTYFNDMGALPPPLNIIPITHLAKLIRYRLGYRDKVPNQKNPLDFKKLVDLLRKRYWSQMDTGLDGVSRDNSTDL